MAAMEIYSSTHILHRTRMPNTPKIARLVPLRSQGKMLPVQRFPKLSNSSLSFSSQNVRICAPYAMNKPMKELSRKFNELKNTRMENIPSKLWEMCPETVRNSQFKDTCERGIRQFMHLVLVVYNWVAMKIKVLSNIFKMEGTTITVWEMCPEPLRNFPWMKACERVLWRLAHLILLGAKWLAAPILIVTFVTETSYCIIQNKELFIPISLFAGGIFAEILKETAIELSQNLKEGDFQQYLFIIVAFFYLIKIPGPYYPYWGRIILPHFANGGLFRTLWLAKDYLYINPSQNTQEEEKPKSGPKSEQDSQSTNL